MHSATSYGHPPSGALQGLDLAPLYENCLFRSDIRKETYNSIATELCDYKLIWRGGSVDARGYRARTRNLSACVIQYGDEVTITPRLYSDFVLAHVCLRKGIEITADRATTFVPEGSVYFSSPRTNISLRWQEGCEQLLLRVPLDMIDPTGRHCDFGSGMVLAKSMTPLFVHQLNTALAISHRGGSMSHFDAWTDHVERGLAQFVGMHLRGPATHRPGSAPPTRTEGVDWRERLEAFIDARMRRPIGLDDLMQATGLGRSQLNALCHRAFGCAPMELVRRMRLQALKAELERNPGQDLTTLALSYGFDHQGRFAQYYRGAFGELPRDTRRRLL
ncbi:AraC family transcriptional regulator [Rhizobium sp. YJ-22]|uniref:AraC family transcriptional regulator n=1 Tax=Rhizobium sp. YJ-22 TaxID=3037556 RepID=UPI002412C529|nr:AraC family transcriptional regulator [Rhizobium sp. YJ-22]MDG3579719.1 AraC family transcriptional regulator [Rhizobium sp. YJ-22]